jgi:hypothetical protein
LARALCLLPGPASDCTSPAYASQVAGITTRINTALLICRKGISLIFCLDQDPLDLCQTSSWDYRGEPPHPGLWWLILCVKCQLEWVTECPNSWSNIISGCDCESVFGRRYILRD